MNRAGLIFHHFGLAVRQPADAIAWLTALGYRIGETVFDPGQNVHLILCECDQQPAVEIIYPGNGPGPVDAMVRRHASGIIYHAGYETRNLAATLAHLESAGLRAICVASPQPAPLFGGRPVSFYQVAGMGLIEILE